MKKNDYSTFDNDNNSEGNRMNVFKKVESEVRSYCRSFPTAFQKATGSTLIDVEGREFLDFFAGAGTLNYGHNHPTLRKAAVEYLESEGILHGLDMMTAAKERFLSAFKNLILEPRNLDYKVMFPGPTGTNSVEAAIKLARKVKGREKIACFTNAFHGMTLGSLALTGNEGKRNGAGLALGGTYFLPYEGYHGDQVNTAKMFRSYMEDRGSGYDIPAAVILETVQGEGGLNACSKEWLQEIAAVCKDHDILLIIDDIQIGCGRSGTFFSFEKMGVTPDIVCLSKSLSGVGLPFALTLFKPELDIWSPGEHNGTFRGNNLAFVTATKSLEEFWSNDEFSREVTKRSDLLSVELQRLAAKYQNVRVKGRGIMQGLSFDVRCEVPSMAAAKCFEKGLIIETSGIKDQVLKVLTPLTTTEEELKKGIAIMEEAIDEAMKELN